MNARRGARGSVGAACDVPIDPPLLPGEVEIDVSDLASPVVIGVGLGTGPGADVMATRRELRSMESQIEIERMIAAARARRRERGDG